MEFIQAFSSTYALDVDPYLDNSEEVIIQFDSFHKLGMHTKEFLEFRFYPEDGPSWIGRFEKGALGDYENVALTTPEIDSVCIISSGAGYWVNVQSREITRLEYLPIKQAVASKKHGLLLIATWRDICGHNMAKAQWCRQGIVYDDLRIVATTDDVVSIEGFDGAAVQIDIEISTGSILKTVRER